MTRLTANWDALPLIQQRAEFHNRQSTFKSVVLTFKARNLSFDRDGVLQFVSAHVHDAATRQEHVEHGAPGWYLMKFGLLPLKYRDQVSLYGFQATKLYVIYSYNTPIGYTVIDEHGTHWAMHIPRVRYGLKTITDHQDILYAAEGQKRDPMQDIYVPVPDVHDVNKETV